MNGESDFLHITPVDDLREHDASEECWCHPRFDDGLFIHHSMDRREEYETGKRLPS